MATEAVKQQLISLYVGYFNRAPDPEGLNYWIGQIDNNEMTVPRIADSFAVQSESTGLYAYLRAPNVANVGSFIDKVYQNLFNRAPDAEGKTYWSNQLTSGAVSTGKAILAIINGAAADSNDAKTVANKVAVGQFYAEQVLAKNNTWTVADDLADAKSVLENVTSDASTVDTGKAAVTTAVDADAAANTAGTTTDLTASVDNLTGTAGDDTFNANITSTSNTLGGLDKVDGGDGTDSLNVADTATAAASQYSLPAGFSLSNVENLNATTNGGVNLDVSAIAGLTAVTTIAAGTANTSVTAADTTNVTTTVSGAATTTIVGGQVVTATGRTGATSITGKGLTSVTVNKGGAATIDNTNATPTSNKGTTLTSVTLNGVDANSGIGGEGLTDVTLTGATTAARTVTITNAKANHALTVNVDGTGYNASGSAQQSVLADSAAKTITVNATGAKSSLSLAGSTAATALIVTGTADLTLNPLASATSLDGSAATGGLTLGALNAATVDVKTGAGKDSFTVSATAKATVDAGAGDDTVTLGSTLAAGSTLNLGAGDDVVLSSSGSVAASTTSDTTLIDGGAGTDSISASLINASNAAQFKNFEALDASASATLDVDLVTGSTIAGLTLSGGAGGAQLTNVATGAGLSVSGSNAGSTTISVKGANTGTSDSFAITFNGAAASAAPTAASVKAGTIVVNNIETVSIASTGADNTWNSIAITDDKLQTVSITGDKNLDLTFAGTNGTNTSANAGGAVKMIDGSAASGKLDIDTTNVTTDDKAGVGLTIKGGSAADKITLVGAATVDAGAGDDQIISAAAGGTFTGGAGKDLFNVATAVATGTTEATYNLTTITDAAAGDQIKLNATVGAAFTSTKVALGSTVTTLDSAVAASTSGATNTASWFQYGGNTYIVASAADGTFAANDQVVELTGLVDLSGATHATDTLTLA